MLPVPSPPTGSDYDYEEDHDPGDWKFETNHGPVAPVTLFALVPRFEAVSISFDGF